MFNHKRRVRDELLISAPHEIERRRRGTTNEKKSPLHRNDQLWTHKRVTANEQRHEQQQHKCM